MEEERQTAEARAEKLSDLAQKNLSSEEAMFLTALQDESQAQSEGYECGTCKDHGFTVNDKGEAVQCDCARMKMYAAEYEASGIPPAHYHWSFNTKWNMHQDAFGDPLGESAKKRKEAIQAFLMGYMEALPYLTKERVPFKLKYPNGNRKSISSLLLVGGTGSGKSMVASIVAQAAVRKGINTRFYDFLELLSVLRDFGKTAEQDALALEWTQADLVVLDGLTGEYHLGEKGPFKMQFDRLAKARINQAKPVVATASVDYKNLETGSAWKGFLQTFHVIDLPTQER